MSQQQIGALWLMFFFGCVPYLGTFFSYYMPDEEPPRTRVIFNRWWFALWSLPGALVVIITAIFG